MLPLENTLYRVENADWVVSLEMTELTLDSKLNVRALKPRQKKQLWYFERSINDPDYWLIKNAANSLMYVGIEDVDDDDTAIMCKSKLDAMRWSISYDNATKTWQFLDTLRDKVLQYNKSKLGFRSAIKGTPEYQRWTLTVEKTGTGLAASHVPALGGMYRIRAFSGAQVLTAPPATAENRVYVKAQDKDDLSQQWEVKQLANGTYEIKNGARPVYLSCEAAGVTEKNFIKALDTTLAWNLEPFAGQAFRITTPWTNDLGDLCIGFPRFEVQDGAEVVFMHSDSGSPSQLWFFERWTQAVKGTQHEQSSAFESPEKVVPPPDYSKLKPYFAYNDTHYYLKSLTRHYAFVDPKDKWTSGNGDDDRVFADLFTPSAKFKIRTMDSIVSNTVVFDIANSFYNTYHLSTRMSKVGMHFLLARDSSLDHLWELFEDGGQGFYMCVRQSFADRGKPKKCVQSTPINEQGKEEFKIVDLVLGDTSMMWKLSKS